MKSDEFVNEDDSTETRFRDTFNAADVILQSIQIDGYDDDWIKVIAKGVEHFRAGTQSKIQFKITCWWNPKSDEASGKVMSQSNSMDKKYSQIHDMDDDQHSIIDFANETKDFITNIATAERDRYAKGEQEYWASGATGMMPGAVHRK